jgi:hypothetical protein
MIKNSGRCHCGSVRFEIVAPEDILVSQCNCSICSKSGYLGLLVARSRFKFLQGEDCLTTYTFNTGVAQHLFCRYCGIKSFYVPRSHPHGYNVNARCLDPGTIENMNVRPFNGQEWEKHSSAFLRLDED